MDPRVECFGFSILLKWKQNDIFKLDNHPYEESFSCKSCQKAVAINNVMNKFLIKHLHKLESHQLSLASTNDLMSESETWWQGQEMIE